jgi:hypothetical protein
MSTDLINSTIVFVAESNNPAMFTSNFLVDLGVIPKGAPIVTSVTIPPFSQIVYGDGYKFEAIEQRIVLSRDYPPREVKKYQDLSADDLPDTLGQSAIDLLGSIGHLRLGAVGINFKLFTDVKVIGNFVERLPDNANPTMMAFVIPSPPFQTTFTFTEAQRTNPPAGGAIIDVNFHGATEESGSQARVEAATLLVQKRSECFQRLGELLNDLGL